MAGGGGGGAALNGPDARKKLAGRGGRGAMFSVHGDGGAAALKRDARCVRGAVGAARLERTGPMVDEKAVSLTKAEGG